MKELTDLDKPKCLNCFYYSGDGGCCLTGNRTNVDDMCDYFELDVGQEV